MNVTSYDVLLVEDDPDEAELFRLAIERERDLRVSHVSALPEALKALGARSFDFIVTDLNLPGQAPDGVVPALKGVAPRSAIVVLSGSEESEAAVDSLRAGAHDYLRKDELTRPLLLRSLRYARERSLVEARLKQIALRDPLTGIPNRGFFDEVLERTVARSRRERRTVALLWLDLDRFKFINDHYGHRAGDTLLCQVADRLVDGLRAADVVCRVGGDEFGIILHGGASTREAMVVARKIRDLIAQPVLFDGVELSTSASIGVAVLRKVDDTGDLIRAADAAMYAAKAAGPGQIRAHNRVLDAQLRERTRIEDALRRAIYDRDELYLAFQPITELATRSLWGLEALLRWRSKELGRDVTPSEFIPVAEESGIIHDLGRVVLDRVIEAHATLGRAGATVVPLSMNVSARQLQRPGFFHELTDAMDEGHLDPGALMIEVTESQVMEDPERTITKLRQLHDRGVRVAIDDFGTGYSSLAWLRDLPVDVLKIDRSFTGSTDARIRDAIVGLGHALGLHVVAEGIEKGSHVTSLQKAGCTLGQGYYLARPAPLETFIAAPQSNDNAA